LLDVFWAGGYQSLKGATVKLYSLHAYHIALSLVTVLYGIGFLLVCWLAESYPRSEEV